MSSWGGWYAWAPRPTVAERQASAAREIAKLQKKGRAVSPVVLDGRTIARTFWGKGWCQHLERYGDVANRIERGRSYVRSGSVVDLQITPGRVEALVRGTSLYTVTITVQPVEKTRYAAIVKACAGKIDSVIELLQGKLSGAVMEVIVSPEEGLFPAPKQIGMRCTCPDGAIMCKHVAAVLYGIGARFDHEPELLFRLRGADPSELVSMAAAGKLTGARPLAREKSLGGDLAGVFGIELDLGPGDQAPAAKRPSAAKNAATKNAATKSAAAAKSAPAKAKTKTAAEAKIAAGRAPATRPPAAKGQRAKAAPPAIITRAALTEMGVPGPTVQYWLQTGILQRTDVRGVYGRTPSTDERLAQHRRLRARA